LKEYFSYYQGGAGDHRPFKVFGATREERDRVAAHIGAYPVNMKEYQNSRRNPTVSRRSSLRDGSTSS